MAAHLDGMGLIPPLKRGIKDLDLQGVAGQSIPQLEGGRF